MKLELQQQDFIEVYPSDSGYVVLKQVSQLGEEALVFIRPDDIARLAKLLRIVREFAIRNRVDYNKQQESL